MRSIITYTLAATLFLLCSCSAYKQDIMLRVTEEDYAILRQQITEAERTYTVRPNDILEVEVFTNKGERIIDPDFALAKELGAGQLQNQRTLPQYIVEANGEVRLPMIGSTPLAGLNLRQADSVLVEAYSSFYEDPYVITRYINKRVVVLGATAKGAQVIPLPNQSMNLLEVLALAGGITGQGKAHNIRLIRGDLDHPLVLLIDLSTIEGMKEAALQVQSGDVIYVEPIRRILPETIRDIAPVVGLISNVLTLVVVIISLSGDSN